MRTLRFGRTIANIDQVVKLEVLQAGHNLFKLSISFSDGTVQDIFPEDGVQPGELADRLAELFKNPRATEIYLHKVIAQMREE